jgi:RNA recognition motif-containing protein
MGKRIYVGNLSYNTTEDGLRSAFAAYGEVVNATVITDRATGQSRGFGFIEMSDDEAVRTAIAALNGQDLDGRPLKVSEAYDRPRPDHGAPRSGMRQ